MASFEEELSALINKHSLEGGSDTPDFILASFLKNVLIDWNHAAKARDRWKAGDRKPLSPPPAHFRREPAGPLTVNDICRQCGNTHPWADGTMPKHPFVNAWAAPTGETAPPDRVDGWPYS